LSYTRVAVDEAFSRVRQLGAEDIVGYPNLITTIDAFFRTNVFDAFIATVMDDVPTQIQVIRDHPPSEISKDAAFDIRGVRQRPSSGGFARPLKAWEADLILDGAGKPTYWYKDDAEKLLAIDDARRSEITGAKAAYIKRGFATFNDILNFSRRLMKSKTLRVAEITAARYREILVDEAQDTTALQQSMLAMLADNGSKISYIGDPKQGIYVFNGANPKYLDELVAVSHKPLELTQNFRSVEEIVHVVNAHFATAMKTERETPPHCGAYVAVGDWEDCERRFRALLATCRIADENAAILVRNRSHLGNVLRPINTSGWSMAPRYALSAWRTERSGNFDDALDAALRLLRAIVDPAWGGLEDDNLCRQLAWRCLKAYCPEPAAQETPRQWGERLRSALEKFIEAAGLPRHKSFGNRASAAHLPEKGDAKKQLSFAQPSVRSTVIHRVKGETIRAVLVVAPKEQHETWLNNTDEEQSNICYVAFTRAADLLVLHCDDEKHGVEWRKRGFGELL
jgi:superfamily I DNA/RNA helicase